MDQFRHKRLFESELVVFLVGFKCKTPNSIISSEKKISCWISGSNFTSKVRKEKGVSGVSETEIKTPCSVMIVKIEILGNLCINP